MSKRRNRRHPSEKLTAIADDRSETTKRKRRARGKSRCLTAMASAPTTKRAAAVALPCGASKRAEFRREATREAEFRRRGKGRGDDSV